MFPATRRSRAVREQEELNITPIMNVFMILVPFLLLTAAFAHTAMVDLTLPVSSEQTETEEDPALDLNLRVSITESGLRVEGNEAALARLPRLATGDYDLVGLERQLGEVREAHPDEQAVIVAAVPSIRYQSVISVMDRCKSAGFSEISVGPADSEEPR